MHYTKRIENLRIDADKTQQQIADILVCQREVYRRYEKGERELPLWAAIKLAEYYNVSLDYLVGLTAKRSPFPKK
ncbi:MAG: helix-turn-helix transcriptional regulator [Clostridiales bacterium]|nr:helix-turn-helix transcriptional regulator [Clostridiales bacterium]MDE7424931.1 helix-turn-helix domain-containing protein [Lachnospiraceae bacterium]